MENTTYGLSAIKSNIINADTTPFTFTTISGISTSYNVERTLVTLSNVLVYGLNITLYSHTNNSNFITGKVVMDNFSWSNTNTKEGYKYFSLNMNTENYQFNRSSLASTNLLTYPIYIKNLSISVTSGAESSYRSANFQIAYKQL